MLPFAAVATAICLGVACLYPALDAWDEDVKVKFWWAHVFVLVFGGMVQKTEFLPCENVEKEMQKEVVWSELDDLFLF